MRTRKHPRGLLTGAVLGALFASTAWGAAPPLDDSADHFLAKCSIMMGAVEDYGDNEFQRDTAAVLARRFSREVHSGRRYITAREELYRLIDAGQEENPCIECWMHYGYPRPNAAIACRTARPALHEWMRRSPVPPALDSQKTAEDVVAQELPLPEKEPDPVLPPTGSNRLTEDEAEKLSAVESPKEVFRCESTRDSIRLLQSTVRSLLVEDLSITGTWNAKTEEALNSFLRELLATEDWGTGWDGEKEPRAYTPEISAHLRVRIALADQTYGRQDITENVSHVVDPMDCLLESNAYPFPAETSSSVLLPQSTTSIFVPEPESEEPRTPTRSSYSSCEGSCTTGALLTSLLNGMTWEFADDLWCRFVSDDPDGCSKENRKRLEDTREDHPLAYAIFNALGILLSLPGLLAIGAAASAKTFGEAFKNGFFIEAGEGVIALIGEAWTFETIDAPGYWFVFTIAAAVLTGSAAGVSAKKHEIIQGMKTLAILGVVVLILIGIAKSKGML